jgi:hypothetical protein
MLGRVQSLRHEPEKCATNDRVGPSTGYERVGVLDIPVTFFRSNRYPIRPL